MKILAAAFLILIHEWYPNDCCHERHCYPVDCNEIHSRGESWEYKGMTIAKNKTRNSPDGACHVCSLGYDSMLCIFMGGSV